MDKLEGGLNRVRALALDGNILSVICGNILGGGSNIRNIVRYKARIVTRYKARVVTRH